MSHCVNTGEMRGTNDIERVLSQGEKGTKCSSCPFPLLHPVASKAIVANTLAFRKYIKMLHLI